MTVLVTGNREYIRSVMVPTLRADGHNVVGPDGRLYERSSDTGSGAMAAALEVRKEVRDHGPQEASQPIAAKQSAP